MVVVNPNGNISVMHDVESLGLAVKKKRKADGLTQQELAAIAMVGVRFISDLENGKPTVQLRSVIRVLKALGLQLVVMDK